MGLRISIDLDDDDLKHFRLVMQEARRAATRLQPEAIVASAEELLGKIRQDPLPRFVRDRVGKLDVMIRMLKDHEWRLPKLETTRVLNALAYFTEPEDLIPDYVPGIGYLDDAIMIELVIRELKHEIDAYEDFCRYRESGSPARGVKSKSTDLTRDTWLERRRKALQDRMRRRRGQPGSNSEVL